MKATDSRLKSIFKKNASAFRRDGSRAKLRDNQKFETALLASRYDVSFTNHQLTTQSSKGQNSLDHQVNRRKSRANLPLSAQAASFMSAGRNPTFQRLGPDMVLQYRTAALSMLNLARDPRVVFDKGTLRRLSLLGTVPDAAVRLHCARAFYLLALRPAVRAAIVQVQSVRYLINNVFRAGSTDPGLALCVAGALCFLTCEDGQEEALIDQGLLHGIQKLMALASGAASGGGGGGAGGEGSAASAGGSGHHPADTQAAFMAVITRYCATAVFNVCCAQSLTVTHVPNLVDIVLRTAETAKSPAAAGAATAAAAAAAAAGGAGDAASAAGEGGGGGGGSAAGLSNGASPRPSASLAPSALGALPRKTQECSGRTFHRLMALRALCNLSERFCDAVLENRGFKVATAAGHGHGGGEEPSEILEAVVATICNAAIQLAGPLRARMIQGEQCVERANALAAVRGQMARQPRRVQELLSMTYRKLARDEGSWGALLGKGVLGALRRLAPLPAAEVRLNVAHALASLVQSREAHGTALVKDATAALHSLVSKPESDPAEEKNELPPELDNAAGVGVLSIKISSGLLATEAAGGGGGGQGGGGGGGGPRSPKTRRSAAAGPAAESDARAAAAAAALGVKQLCATVMSLLQTAPEMVHALIENKAFELLEKILDDVDLSSPKGLEIGEICCRVIYNCCCCNSLRLQDYMTDGIFGFLLKTISEGSLQSKELASGALWRFMHIAGDAEVEMGKVNRIVQVLDQALHEYEQSPPRGGGGGGRRGSRPPGGGGGGDADDQAKHAIKSNVLGTVCAIVRYHFGRMTLESKKRIAAEMITFCRSEDQPVTLANVASVLCVLSQSNIESGGELFGDDLIARDLLPAIMKPMSVAGRPQVILLCVITLANMAKDRRLAMLIVHGRGNFNPQKQGFEGFLQSMVKSSLSYGGQDNLKLGVASILATLSQYDCELELMKQGLATEIMALGLLHDTRNRTSAANKRLCALMLHNIVTALLPGPNHSIGASQEDHMGAALRDSKSFAWALCNLAESEEEATRQMSLAALANLSALPPFLRGLCHTDHAVRAMRGVCARPDCAPATRRAVANLVCNMCHHEEGIVHLDGTDKKPEDSIVHTLLDNLQVGMEENDIELQTVTAQAVCALAYVGCETSRGVFLRAILKICQVVEANPSQALVKAVAMAMTATAYYSPRALVQDGEGEPLVQPFFAALRLVLGLRGCGLDHRDFCISVLHHLTAEEANLPHLIDYGALELMQEVIEGELRKGGVFSAALVNWCVELMHNLAAGRERAAKMVSMGVCAFVASVLAQPNATAHTVQIAGQFVSNLCRAKINTNRLCRDHAFHILQQWVQISDAEDTNISASIAIRKLVQAIGNHEIADKANVLGMTMAIFRRCASAAAATHCAATLARLAVNARLAPRFRALGVAAEIRRMALAPDRLPPPAKRFCLAALCTLSRYEEEHTMPSKKKEMPSKLKIIASRDDDESDNDDDQKEQASQKSSAEELAGIASSIMNLVFTEADDQGPQGSRADEISHIVSMLQDLEKQETDHELKQKQGVLESLLSMQSGASSSDKSKWTAPTYSISRRESTKSVKERAISLSRMLHEEDLGLSGNFQNDDANKFSSEDFGIEQLPPPTPFRHEKYFVEEGTFENDLAALGTLSFEPALAPRALPPGKLRQLLADGGGGGGGGGGAAHHPHHRSGGGGGGQQAAARYLTTYPKHVPGQDDVMDEQMLSSRLEDYEDDRKLSMLLQQSRPHTSPAPAQDPRFRDDSLSSALSATSVLSDFQTGFARNKSASHFKQLIQMLDTQHTDLDGAESPPTTMIDDNDKRNSILGQTDLSHRRSWIKFPGGGGGAAVGGAGGDGGGNLPPLGAAAAAAAPRRSIFEQAAARHARHHPEHADTFEDNDAAAAAAAAVGSPLRAGAGALEKTASAKKKDFGRGGKRTSTVSFKLDPEEEDAPVHDRPSIEGPGLYSVGSIFMNKVAETQRQQQQQQQQQQGTRRAPPSSAHGGGRGAAAAAAARRGSERRATAMRRGEEGGAAAAEGGRAAAAPGDLGSGRPQQDRPVSSKLSAATERRKKHVTAAILMNRKHNRILRGQGVQPSDQRAKAAYQRPPPPAAARARFSATAPAGLGRPGATGGGGGGGGQVGRRRREEEEAAARLAAEIFERGGPPRAFASPLADYRAKYTYELDLEGPLTRARKEERRKLKKKLLGNKSAGDIEEGRASMATAGTAIQNQRASFTGQPSSNTWTETALAPQAIAFVQHSGSRMSGGIGVRVAPPQYGEKDDSLTSLTNPTKNEKNRRNSLR